MDTAIRPSPIDLYLLRCAVAVLLDSVGHQGLMDSAGYRRIDIAVQILSGAPLPPTSAIRRAINRLLSPDDDPNGSRTLDAIAELAGLTHVDTASAPALAAQLVPSLPKPHQGGTFGDHPVDGGENARTALIEVADYGEAPA